MIVSPADQSNGIDNVEKNATVFTKLIPTITLFISSKGS